MKKLLSLPPNLVRKGEKGGTIFHQITELSEEEYFCTCDPEGHRIGSGGGSAWLLMEAFRQSRKAQFDEWLSSEKRILLHAGGQSRRLPSYAPSGKILTPIPVFRWERGQRLSQDLMSLQLPLYEQMMNMTPKGLNTMIVSGDVLIRTSQPVGPVPQADVVVYGLWLDASVAKNHGVFVSDRRTPQVLKQMLQKPSVEELHQLQKDHYYLTDIGVWILSDRAIRLLMNRCMEGDASANSQIKYYDLYSDFGRSLGTEPLIDDAEIKSLSVAVVPLAGGEFYHFGTSREMISSTVVLQNLVCDQRQIMHHDLKPHPSIFVQNALLDVSFSAENQNIWIENSHIGKRWKLTSENIVTGVPRNDWQITLAPGQCLDVVPIGGDRFAVRLYHIDDRFDGAEQQRKQFPVLAYNEIEPWLQANLSPHPSDIIPHPSALFSAEEISAEANLARLFEQRVDFRKTNWSAIARNWHHSVFYQLDLDDAAHEFKRYGIPMPAPLEDDAPLMVRIHDAMFRGHSDEAFGLLRQGLTERVLAEPQQPQMSVMQDQIVWGRSPVRIDIAGGWTDTPPYCLLEGGNVVNLAIELNGQPPLQTYVKPCAEPRIVLRSIDLGASEVVETYEQLQQFNRVGSPFSIPKAALALAGFLPQFSVNRYPSLKAQLEAFGCGIELTLLSAIPAGSGLGTSSILAATVLGAVSDFCSLAWDKNEIGRRTLVLEQLLTTGGGWQDQFGGVLGGVKLLQTQSGFDQAPLARWLPTDLYVQPEYQQCHLLYYTGITRTAKHILAEIVRRMFLNNGEQLRLLRQMKEHTMMMYDAIQRQDFVQMGTLVRRTWEQNQLLDSGTNPAQVRQLTDLIDDLCLGYKLPGAGGGGYLYMVAKSPEAAARIRRILTGNRLSSNARFVDMSLSLNGLQISRS
ncbi:bifunctional fucokinase/L-fucose-1-P-guanylyltransferase [Prevotella communis]|uniref:bifunctional fucokinase/fucose-1-phosphate guanylyltransferase n=1 Tax=Prevotella communis TaxID=2913614 RepID=UPI001EDAA08A|nr:bifunctional fucokinase/fucose-1-phosphate guanylyltransferase [Prevotella communis]UKK61717.1 bifunctional fucokinase/L-fucose-1-P-guanylyltransferase [Prevotella communis]UKK64543.1 bifunctional fucokinase/L-fucose-1-P-guanylyltransferase [Prevotella communis]